MTDDKRVDLGIQPALANQIWRSLKSLRNHISGGPVQKGGHNGPASQIKVRPPAPTPTRKRRATT